MFRERLCGLVLAASVWAPSARAQEQVLPTAEITYERALALAREEAPALATARARTREAERHIDAASVWRFNPEVSVAAGPRFRSTGPSDGVAFEGSVSAEQWFELGGQRGARVSAARAGAEASVARSEDVERLLLRDVRLTFISALYWERRMELAEENLHIVESVAGIASRRHDVGEVGGLEQTVSELAALRARTDVDRARASLTQAKGRLKALLGIDAAAEVACVGDLRELGIHDTTTRDVGDRADLRALQSDIRQAEAEADLGRAGRVPALAFGASYSREETANIVQATLTMALPVFDHGQGTSAVAEARRERLVTELGGARRAARVEAHTANTTTELLRASARRFEQEGLALLERSERVATATYEAGAIPLGELLAARREVVQAKLDYIDLLLGAASAQAELAATPGALR